MGNRYVIIHIHNYIFTPHMKNTLLLLTITTLFLSSCSKAQLGKQILDLESIPMSFNVNGFYQAAIEKAKQKHAENASTKEQLDDFLNTYFIGIDTIKKDEFEKASPVLGVQYNMTSWNEGDTLATFQALPYCKINMMINESKEFIALCASSDQTDSAVYQKTIQDMTKKYGQPEKQQEDFLGIHTNLSWKLQDRMIQLVSKIDNRGNTMAVEIGGKEVMKQITQAPTFKTYLFVIKKQYQDSLRGAFKSGDWLYLE